MAKKDETKILGSVIKTSYQKINGRFRAIKKTRNNNVILNSSKWRQDRKFDTSIGAKGILSSGGTYTSAGYMDIMLKYTSISPDGNLKSVREYISGTAKKTNMLL